MSEWVTAAGGSGGNSESAVTRGGNGQVTIAGVAAGGSSGRAAEPAGPTWRDVARLYPEFVQWVVQRHGGVPDGPVTQEDYARLSNEYAEATRDGTT